MRQRTTSDDGVALSLQERRRGKLIVWAAYFAFWTVLGALQAAGHVLYSQDSTTPASVWLIRGFLDLHSWGLLVLAVLWIAQRFPIRREHWARDAIMHFVIGVIVIGIRLYATNALAYVLGIGQIVELLFLIRVLPLSLPMYFACLGAGYAIRYLHEIRQRDLAAAQLKSDLAAAQVQVLRMQMQPHFLFNALNSVVTLIHHDPASAERVVVNLSEMLRRSLAPNGAPEITLRQELELLAPYLDIERTRLRDRLQVQTFIPGEVLDARLPQLTLQALVENAVRHGVAPRRGPGRITITAQREGGVLRVSVQDDGAGSSGYWREGGIGLPNLRNRLQQLYGEHARLRVTHIQLGGTLAEVVVPFSAGEAGPAPET